MSSFRDAPRFTPRASVLLVMERGIHAASANPPSWGIIKDQGSFRIVTLKRHECRASRFTNNTEMHRLTPDPAKNVGFTEGVSAYWLDEIIRAGGCGTVSNVNRAKPIQIGIIGCGNVLTAYRPTLDSLRLRGLAEARLICGREAQRTRAEEELGVIPFTTREEDVLSSPEISVVLILTSMNEHARLAGAALAAGKHVVMEKPLGTNLPDAQNLLQTARRSRGFLVCAPFTLLSPTFQAISRRMEEGAIGKPCLARARYGWSGPWWNEWFYKPGGGCLFDLGVYGITTLTGLLGPALRVVAMTGIAIPEREVNGRKIKVEAEDTAQVLLDFGDGASAVVTTGFTMQQYRNPAVEIYGTTGTIQMLGDDWDPDGYELWQNSAGSWQLFKETHPDWSWTAGLPHLIDCLRSGTRPEVTPEHAFHVLEIMLKAKESSRDGRAAALESTFTKPRFGRADPGEAAHLVHDRNRAHAGELRQIRNLEEGR